MAGLAALVRLDGEFVREADLLPVLDGLGTSAQKSGPRIAAPGDYFAFGSISRFGSDDPLEKPGPTSDRTGNVWLAFDGRIDNREELSRALSLAPGAAKELSDVELLFAGIETWGDGIFARIVGPFAAIVLHIRARHLRLYRDPLGSRTLYVRERGPLVAIASRAAALTRFPDDSLRLDEGSIARYLALQGPMPGATFFQGVEEIRPGAIVGFRPSGRQDDRLPALRADVAADARTDDEYEERFRVLLDLAVASRLPKSGATAILMSGGLDSTSVAATAAIRLARLGEPPPEVISWVYSTLPGIDESPWIETVSSHHHLRQHYIRGDDFWPLAAESQWPRFQDSPFLELYWLLVARSLELTRESGSTVLLTGHWGDHLWGKLGRSWLRDLLFSGRFGEALTSLARGARMEQQGLGLAHPLRSSLGQLLRPAGFTSSAPSVRPRWLTSWAVQKLEATQSAWPSEPTRNLAETQVAAIFAPYDQAISNLFEREAALFGVEMRHPYRDRRLVEFFLGVPPRLLYRPGETKRLLRRALADRLPESVLHRRLATSMRALADRGLNERARPLLRAVLESPNALWPQYVDRRWLRDQLNGEQGTGHEGPEGLVVWHCYSLERWRSSAESPGSGVCP